MIHWQRYSVAAFGSTLITAALILGMHNLLGKQPHRIQTKDFALHMVHNQKEDKVRIRKRHKRKLPKKNNPSQPPTRPKLTVDTQATHDLSLAKPMTHAANLNILGQINLPGLNHPIGKPQFNGQGGVKGAIPPLYPMNALMNDIEGWVKVLITVNAMGQATAVKVMDAYPPRTFNDAAVKTVLKWQYYRKKVGDEHVSYQLSQTIEFVIPKPEENEE